MVDRRERRRAPHAGVDAIATERADERQRAVDAAAPQHPAVEEFLRMVRHQPRFAFAVADLLAPVRLHRRAVVMPDQRRRREADLPAARLQPPAHVDVVAGAEVDRVEAADREQRVAAERHVAARARARRCGRRAARGSGRPARARCTARSADRRPARRWGRRSRRRPRSGTAGRGTSASRDRRASRRRCRRRSRRSPAASPTLRARAQAAVRGCR